MRIHMNLGQAWGPAELASSEAATRRQQEAGGITFIYFKFPEQKQRRCSSLDIKGERILKEKAGNQD